MKLSAMCIGMGLVFCAVFTGCAEMDRKFDEALYGSVEKAEEARAESAAAEQAKFSKNLDRFEKETLFIINGERKKYRSPVATATPQLQEAARVRAQELTERYSEYRPKGGSFTSVFEEHGIERSANALLKGLPSPYRELRAVGPKKPIEVYGYWLSRPADKKVLLKADNNRMAVSASIKNGKTYWVLLAY